MFHSIRSPTQHELDSSETVSPPRSRKYLVAAIAMIAGVVLIAMAVVGTVTLSSPV